MRILSRSRCMDFKSYPGCNTVAIETMEKSMGKIDGFEAIKSQQKRPPIEYGRYGVSRISDMLTHVTGMISSFYEVIPRTRSWSMMLLQLLQCTTCCWCCTPVLCIVNQNQTKPHNLKYHNVGMCITISHSIPSVVGMTNPNEPHSKPLPRSFHFLFC